ncbi:MAG TPA: cytochrome ubiquinol oxidase subunit I [Candidatus Binataceae bacterium]|nr:cytochrome ubiquinol oxidase subunit I [Candidatus Binataceae bacterium]
MDALTVDRIQFAFTIIFHYLFPQLTMGLALLIVILKSIALRTNNDLYNQAAHFWARIFAINFAMGVVTGIPMEFQFGTNWAAFSKATGGVIGQTLAMEGVFSFFLESSFLGLFLFGERRLGPRLHWMAAFLVFLGSWLSGFFIIATNAWMQHPVGYRITATGAIELESFWSLLSNPWLRWQYPHNMSASVITASVVMAATGAFYLLTDQHRAHARIFVRTGVIAGAIASCLMMYPLGDAQGRNVAIYQPTTLSAMEGLFHTQKGAPLSILGQPDMQTQTLDNPVVVPDVLSFLTYRRWHASVKGLDAYPHDQWPDNVPLLYYAYHNMVGLGTFFIAILVFCLWNLWRGVLFESRLLLWALMLLAPFPYIATIFGWMTAELGRQPWLVYGLIRTAQGASPQVSAGNVMFTLIGFAGMYAVLSALFLFLIYFEVSRGPHADVQGPAAPARTAAGR